MDLSGTWRAAVANDDLRRTWLDEPFDDRTWAAVPVPSHWRSTPEFADTDGPLLYRRVFAVDAPRPGERAWLELDGLFYQGDVWLDGVYLGDTEGYFVPYRFEVTDRLAARSEHTLGVEVACPRPTDLTAKRAITGVFQHWDCLDPDWNPGGLWRPLRVRTTGPVAISRMRVLCREATAERAIVALGAELDAAEAATVTVRTTVAGIDHESTHPLAAGRNQVQWTVTVPDPALWWPHALGEQPLAAVEVRVFVDEPNEATRATSSVELSDGASDIRRLTTGLRSVRLRNWMWHVNGERLFVKGANQGPTRRELGEASAATLERDVALAIDSGLDLLRVCGHISRAELYDAADRAGLLLWQDFPLQWGYHRSIRKEAVRQVSHAVDMLGHHPSVALWCGHNEPLALDVRPDESPTPAGNAEMVRRFFVGQELPSWNKTVLDRSVKRALRAADSTRPVIAHSGVLPHPPTLDGTDSHLYFGWYHGEVTDLDRMARLMPRLVRFVSEFGAQAVPRTADFVDTKAWPNLDWARLGHTYGLQKAIFDQRVPPGAYESFDAWRAATQSYQARLVKHHIETLRRLKYRPCGGFAVFAFGDAQPGVSWSVLDHERVPKSAFDALVAACRPLIVVADWPPAECRVGDTLALDVHVVNDLRGAISDGVVTVRAAWPGDEQTWQWSGDVAADACVKVGRVKLDVPEAMDGTVGNPELVIDLVFESDVVGATNQYRSRIGA